MSATREREIFIELVAHVPPEQWQGRLAELAGEDAELHGKVARLLAAHRQADSFLEQPAAPLGGTVDDAPASAASAGPPAEPELAERPGTVIGPYKLMEQIGEGGFGLVFVAEQQAPVRRKVALKIIKPGMDCRQVIARFEAEPQALAMMDHQNIAKVLDAGATASGRPYFVMELVHGSRSPSIATPITSPPGSAWGCLSPSARPSNTHTRRELFIGISSRRTSW